MTQPVISVGYSIDLSEYREEIIAAINDHLPYIRLRTGMHDFDPSTMPFSDELHFGVWYGVAAKVQSTMQRFIKRDADLKKWYDKRMQANEPIYIKGIYVSQHIIALQAHEMTNHFLIIASNTTKGAGNTFMHKANVYSRKYGPMYDIDRIELTGVPYLHLQK